jgi:LmbE family N-acetylglucosaminyl deacetylase
VTSLYLFSHQDDEIGVMHDIVTARARGERAVCVFLTDGAWGGVNSATRNAESLRVLSRLGVAREDILFLGESAGISDGRLVECLEAAGRELARIAASLGPFRRVITHAWEGGHHDHDAAHLLGRALADHLGVTAASRQYCLYRAGNGAAGFVFDRPDPELSVIEHSPMSMTERLRYLSLLRHYRSQARVMLQLGPRIFSSYVLGGVQRLQHLPSVDLVARRPAARLLYEEWGLYDWERFERHAASLVARLSAPDGAAPSPAPVGWSA